MDSSPTESDPTESELMNELLDEIMRDFLSEFVEGTGPDWFLDWIRNARNETDRGLALASAAFLEDSLQELFVDSYPAMASGELFKGYHPLSGFAAKIEVARARAKNLDLIRKIRNDFAHKRESNLKFESPSINDRVDALTIPNIPKNIPVNFSWKDRRGKFRRIVSAEAAFLHGHGKLAKLAAEKPTTDEI